MMNRSIAPGSTCPFKNSIWSYGSKSRSFWSKESDETSEPAAANCLNDRPSL